MTSWYNNEMYFLGFIIVEAIFIGISYLLVLREVDRYYEEPNIKNPRTAMFRIGLNHFISMNIYLIMVFVFAIVVNFIWKIF